METSMLAYFTHLNTCLEAQAVLPRQTIGTGSLAIAERRLLWSAWNIKMNGDAGRYDKRDPAPPLNLSDIVLNGLQADSHVLLSDPSLPVYLDPMTTYFARMVQLETELKSRYRGIPTPDADQLTLLGPYGAIVTSVSNFDTPYLVIATGEGQWINAWHEMGDQPQSVHPSFNGVFRFGAKTCWPLTKYHLSAIRVGPGDAENPAFPPSGSITWVNLPADWSAVPDPNVYLFRDDFMGETLDKWEVIDGASGVCEIDPLFQWLRIQKSTGGWGTQGVAGKAASMRVSDLTLEFDVLVRDNGTALIGWINTEGQDYTNFSHGLLFETGAGARRISIFENGVNRGATAINSIVPDRIYHVKIIMQIGGGVQYLIQGAGFAQLGGPDFTDITPETTFSMDDALKPAAFTSLGSMYVSDFRIY